eukprot:Pgem_evm1s17762
MSGTSLLIGSESLIGILTNQIGDVYQDCSNRDKLTDISFVLNGNEFTLKGKDYVVELEGECQLGITAAEQMNVFILGDVFM